jgi:hypothetical protein
MAGKVTWKNLTWVQNMRGSQTGLAQSWLRMELQWLPAGLMAQDMVIPQAIPYFGSVALYYEMHQ